MGTTPARVREGVAAQQAGAGILGDASVPAEARKLLVLRPAAMAAAAFGEEADGWRLVAEAAGDTPVLVWTEEEEGRLALRAQIPNLPELIRLAAKKKKGL